MFVWSVWGLRWSAWRLGSPRCTGAHGSAWWEFFVRCSLWCWSDSLKRAVFAFTEARFSCYYGWEALKHFLQWLCFFFQDQIFLTHSAFCTHLKPIWEEPKRDCCHFPRPILTVCWLFDLLFSPNVFFFLEWLFKFLILESSGGDFVSDERRFVCQGLTAL